MRLGLGLAFFNMQPRDSDAEGLRTTHRKKCSVWAGQTGLATKLYNVRLAPGILCALFLCSIALFQSLISIFQSKWPFLDPLPCPKGCVFPPSPAQERQNNIVIKRTDFGPTDWDKSLRSSFLISQASSSPSVKWGTWLRELIKWALHVRCHEEGLVHVKSYMYVGYYSESFFLESREIGLPLGMRKFSRVSWLELSFSSPSIWCVFPQWHYFA